MECLSKRSILRLSCLLLLLFADDAVRIRRSKHSRQAHSLQKARDALVASPDGHEDNGTKLPNPVVDLNNAREEPVIESDSVDGKSDPFRHPSDLSDVSGLSDSSNGSQRKGRGKRLRERRAQIEAEGAQTYDVKGVAIPNDKAFHAYSILRVSEKENATGPFVFFQLEYSKATVEWKQVAGFVDTAAEHAAASLEGKEGNNWEILRIGKMEPRSGAFTATDRQNHPIYFPEVYIKAESHSTARRPKTGGRRGQMEQSPGQSVSRFVEELHKKNLRRSETKGGGLSWEAKDNNCQHFIESVIATLCHSNERFMELYKTAFEHHDIVMREGLSWVVSLMGHYGGKVAGSNLAKLVPGYSKIFPGKLAGVKEIEDQDITPYQGRILEIRVYWNDATAWAKPMVSLDAVAEDAKKRATVVSKARKFQEAHPA